MHTLFDTMRMARLGTLLFLFLPACLSASGTEATRDGASPDGGAPPGLEQGVGCYDGLDNDVNGLSDCSDPACGGPVCCVGSGSPDCCQPDPVPTTFEVPADCVGDLGCAELDPAQVPFGQVAPIFEGGGLVPQGGETYGGLALAAAQDPRIVGSTIVATIEVPAGRCTSCIDAAGVGFFDGLPTAGERGSVRLGALVNGGRGELQVIVTDEVVGAIPIEEGTHTLTLISNIDGSANVTVASEPEPAIAYETILLQGLELPPTLRPVAFGRTQNRAVGESAVNVRGVTLSRSRCDVPSALDRAASPVLPSASSTFAPSGLGLGRPTFVEWSGRKVVAFAHDGELLIAEPTADGNLVGASGPPDSLYLNPPGVVALSDPWLVSDGAVLYLYFAGEADDGTRSIWQTGATDFDFGAATEVLVPPAGYDSVDGPTVWREGTTWRMIARIVGATDSRLVGWVSNDGLEWQLDGTSVQTATVRAPDLENTFAADRDEVATPAMVRVGGTYRLYYSARRGSRWSVALLVSEDLQSWRSMGAVLEGSDSGFDALGVRHPAPIWGTSPPGFYYLGTDGITAAFGRAGPAGT